MSFFDSKEEVIKIELTQYGKYLLSIGKLNPKYYDFFDDDILYDVNYTNISESQNNSQIRIIDETPYLKPQAYFSSVEKNADAMTQIFSDNKKKYKQSGINDTMMPYPIGTSDVTSEYIPAWNISVLSGSISSSSENYTKYTTDPNSSYQFIKIPQLNMKPGIFNISMYDQEEGVADNESILVTLDNGETILYTSENLYNLFEIVEKNVQDKKENFIVEVFIEEDGEWNKLYFTKQFEDIKNNILTDSDIIQLYSPGVQIDSSLVEHYFDVLSDADAVPNIKRNTTIYTSPVTKEDEPFGDKC